MSAEALIALIQAILKLAPEVISLIEGIIGHGNSIPADQIPQILSQVAELSKNSTPSETPIVVSTTTDHPVESSTPTSIAS